MTLLSGYSDLAKCGGQSAPAPGYRLIPLTSFPDSEDTEHGLTDARLSRLSSGRIAEGMER